LKNRKVLHCDISAENIPVDDTKKVIKLCDFGSARRNE
jgi:serine/threonine protein kinase